MDFFFVYPFWQCVVEENTDHNYSLSVRCILSLCVAVSLIIVLFFFSKVGIWLYFLLLFFLVWYALRETVNNCIIHWTEEDGTHYVYLKLVSWCNKRWRWVVYLNVLLEASMNVCMLLDFLVYVMKENPKFWLWLKVSTGVGGCKTKSFHRQTHTPAVPAAHVQPFDVIYCRLCRANQSPSQGTFLTTYPK